MSGRGSDALGRDALDAFIARVGPAAVTEGLSEYVSERRRARIEAVVAARMFDVAVAVEDPYDPHNAAAVVRSAEITGASEVHVIRASSRILHSKRTTTGAFNWVATRHHATLASFLAYCRSREMLVAGACVGGEEAGGSDLEALPADRPICLLLGNEHAGLSDEARQACDIRYGIAMHGFSESFNLSVSAAISLYSLTTRRRAALGRPGDGTPERLDHTRALYYALSVDRRLLLGLFPDAVTP